MSSSFIASWDFFFLPPGNRTSLLALQRSDIHLKLKKKKKRQLSLESQMSKKIENASTCWALFSSILAEMHSKTRFYPKKPWFRVKIILIMETEKNVQNDNQYLHYV